ncbi:hypothetical protein JYT72_02360 [Crocinitomix catalasitica]|nr:hypothetical protein [Crocinitomix catalasitica]
MKSILGTKVKISGELTFPQDDDILPGSGNIQQDEDILRSPGMKINLSAG